MLTNTNYASRIYKLFQLFRQALKGGEQDYTRGSVRRAIFMLAIPMILEMCMESVFAVVDAFFVGKLGEHALATVGLTESVLTIVYSIAIGLSMAATAMVARRIGEKNPEAASRAGMQALLISLGSVVLISLTGIFFAEDILRLMGATASTIAEGAVYTRIMMGGSIVIILLFLINGIFRGAGDASIAMRSLWIANGCNIVLCPLLINGWGPFPELGLKGAAIATTIGRGIGVAYQLFKLLGGKGMIRVRRIDLSPDWAIIKSLLNIAWSATLQFLIGSASWIFIARIISGFGEFAMAGYTVAIRIVIFFIMPAWGLSNAAATLVGQNLGAGQPDRAEKSVWLTARYSAIFMACVSLFFFLAGDWIVATINDKPEVVKTGAQALRIISLGYIFYGIGMVVTQSFNGAGDTKTPTWISLFGFWAFQIPLAWLLAYPLEMGPQGTFIAIVVAEAGITIASVILFKRGRWKLKKV